MLAHWFAEKLNCVEHEQPHCTVATTMILAAMYMGAKEIYLHGVDHAWLPTDPTYREPCYPVTNQHGEELITFDTFKLVGVTGLEVIAKAHPEVKIYQSGRYALDMQGIEFKELPSGKNSTTNSQQGEA